MKEHIKWWANVSASYLSDVEVDRDGRLTALGWRAALEMVKSKTFEHKEALDIIEEELEDG